MAPLMESANWSAGTKNSCGGAAEGGGREESTREPKESLKHDVYRCLACMYICALLACLVSSEARKGIGFPGTGVLVNGELLCGCW